MDWKPKVLAEGLEFPEGPISMGGGVHLYVTYSGTGQLVAFDCDWEALPLYPNRVRG